MPAVGKCGALALSHSPPQALRAVRRIEPVQLIVCHVLNVERQVPRLRLPVHRSAARVIVSVQKEFVWFVHPPRPLVHRGNDLRWNKQQARKAPAVHHRNLQRVGAATHLEINPPGAQNRLGKRFRRCDGLWRWNRRQPEVAQAGVKPRQRRLKLLPREVDPLDLSQPLQRLRQLADRGLSLREAQETTAPRHTRQARAVWFWL